MKITTHELSFTLTEKDLSVWMAALRLASKHSSVPIIPWDSCPFLAQHKELVRLTGYGSGDHQDLHEYLKAKYDKTNPTS